MKTMYEAHYHIPGYINEIEVDKETEHFVYLKGDKRRTAKLNIGFRSYFDTEEGAEKELARYFSESVNNQKERIEYAQERLDNSIIARDLWQRKLTKRGQEKRGGV